ncbi:phosphodiesterase gamma, putative [Hepatocystis sp. ex Piliocolobus tephrosceles]|nr:phosphodiesterase gamma, putative [Hepatocystis sp. ex Piliocolobus tephrosceles]
MLDDKKLKKCGKNDKIRKAFTFFSFPSYEEENVLNVFPLKFIDNQEESIYADKICDNIYKKRYVIFVFHLMILLMMYYSNIIKRAFNDLFYQLKLTYLLLHGYAAFNLILMFLLLYTNYVEKLKKYIEKCFVIYMNVVLILWVSWLFILFIEVKYHLPNDTTKKQFLFAIYTPYTIKIFFSLYAYLPLFFLITVVPCRLCYTFYYDITLLIIKVAIYTYYFIVTVKKYFLIDKIFMMISVVIGSFFIFILRHIFEYQRRLTFHNSNKHNNQIMDLKINLKEKEKLAVTNIETIHDLINDSLKNFYNNETESANDNQRVLNNLEKVLSILKEDNLFSPELKTTTQKNYNNIYDYIMSIKQSKYFSSITDTSNKDLASHESKYIKAEETNEFKDESQTESITESLSELKPPSKTDLPSIDDLNEKQLKNSKYTININMDTENIDVNQWDVKFLNRPQLNYDIFIQIGKKLLSTCYTDNQQISDDTLFSLLHEMKNGYNNVPYHNCIHAAMVTQHCNILVNNLETSNILKDNELAAFFISTLGHDIGHFGRTNFFLKNNSNFLNMIYNDKSILENYHCSYLFSILNKDKNNIFKNETSKSLLNLRNQIIEVILATDMSKHIKILAQFRIKSIKIKSYVEKNILLCLKMVIKAADLAHNCVDWDEHYLWVKRLINEFYCEGDEQLEKGCEINPLFDRYAHDHFIQMQKTFLKELVFPLVTSIKTLDNRSITKIMIEKLKKNYAKWTAIEKNNEKKKKCLENLINDIPDSWKNKCEPNLSIYQF